jgi:hypothetical protein
MLWELGTLRGSKDCTAMIFWIMLLMWVTPGLLLGGYLAWVAVRPPQLSDHGTASVATAGGEGSSSLG